MKKRIIYLFINHWIRNTVWLHKTKNNKIECTSEAAKPAFEEKIDLAALPIFNELHSKVIFPDVLDVVPKDTAPFIIYAEEQTVADTFADDEI